MAHHGGIAGALRHLDCLQCLGQAADLVHLDQDRVRGAQLDALPQAGGVRDEQVVAHQLDLPAQALGQPHPAVPVLLGEAVLDGDDGVAVDELLPVVDHLVGRQAPALALQLVQAGLLVIELARGGVHRKREVAARLEARLAHGTHQVLEGLGIRLQVGGKAALVAHAGGKAGLAQYVLQGVVHLARPAQRGLEVGRAHGHDHELLEVHVVVRVDAAVQHVHHRHGQGVPVRAAQVLVQRQVRARGRGACDGKRRAQDGVCAQATLVGGAVRRDHRAVHGALVGSLHANQKLADLAVHVRDGIEHALAQVAVLVAVAQLNGLELAGRRTGGNDGAAKRPVLERYLHLDGRVCAGIQHLACVYVLDLAHVGLLTDCLPPLTLTTS